MARVEQIRAVLSRQPFRAFGLKMVDGTVYTVKHPDWITFPPFERARDIGLFQMPEGVGPNEVDRYACHWLDLTLISEVIEAVQMSPQL